MKKFLVAIDQGTTSTRVILFDLKGNIKFTSQFEFKQYFPKNGWVEHNPNEIWSTVKKVLLDVINPANEESISKITIGNKIDLDLAVSSAKDAFSEWSYSSVKDRLSLLEKLETIYQNRFDDMTDAITQEMGCPSDFSSQVQTQSGLDHISDFIKRIKSI